MAVQYICFDVCDPDYKLLEGKNISSNATEGPSILIP